MIPNEIFSKIQNFLFVYKWTLIVMGISIIVAYASVLILGKNNPVELEIEKMIDKETGLDINLTP